MTEHTPEERRDEDERREGPLTPATERSNAGTERELRDESTARDPLEGNELAEADQVLVDSPGKLAHEDQVPSTLKEQDEAETRDGGDIEGGKTARELYDERVDAAREVEGERRDRKED